MTLQEKHVWRHACDRCGWGVNYYYDTIGEATRRAIVDGWKLDNVRSTCPECLRKEAK